MPLARRTYTRHHFVYGQDQNRRENKDYDFEMGNGDVASGGRSYPSIRQHLQHKFPVF